MANVLIYNTDNGRFVDYLKSVNTPDYEGRPDVLINPDMNNVTGVEKKYQIVDSGSVREMTQQEKDIVDAEIIPDENAKNEANADNLNVTIKQAFIAWLDVYNSKVPSQYKVTGAELKQQLKDNIGL